ncbi:MAG: MaoC family dehydratase [Pseudorhodobacter sp.]
MGIEQVTIGEEVRFAKTVGEYDVYGFAGITGDFAGNHVNEAYMAKSRYGRRIAHGALLVGYMSAASTLFQEKFGKQIGADYAVSLGYDRVRFIAPVFIGDTIEVTYRMARTLPEKMRTISELTVRNQDGEVVAAAEHILRWLPE